MAIHDWTRVHAGTFHHFHLGWLVHLAATLNEAELPAEYYALLEQHDYALLEGHAGLEGADDQNRFSFGGETVPPEVALTMELSDEEAYRLKQKTLVIRHVTDHRVVALVEIVSPSNKAREAHVSAFVERVRSAIRREIHVVLIDLLPPGPHDPSGIHGRVLHDIGVEKYAPPEGKPLTLASYNAAELLTAYIEPTAVGAKLTPMPLFLALEWYINLPLQETYETAYQGVPRFWQRVIEGDEQA